MKTLAITFWIAPLVLAFNFAPMLTEAPAPVVAEAEAMEEEPPSTEPAAPAKTRTDFASDQEWNKHIVTIFGTAAFGEEQVPALLELVQKESSFQNNVKNKRSTAYGLFQFLDSTWENYGYEKTSDPITQTEAGVAYIKSRYGSPSNALEFHRQNGWY